MEDTPITWHDVVTGMAEWRQQHPHATFREIEAALDARLVHLRAHLLQEVALAAPATDWSSHQPNPPTCPHCHLPLTARGQHTRHVVTQGGRDVALTRTYGTCPRCGSGLFPLDEELALPAGPLSPPLQEWLVRLATWMPFAQAARVLTDFTHVAVSEATVRRLTETAGAAYVAVQTAEVVRIEQELPAAPTGPARAVVAVDGAMVPLRGGEWAEVRTVAIGSQPPPGPTQSTPRTTDLSYFSRLTDAASFERLSLVETQRRGLEHAGALAGVADGAEWVQSFLDTHCPQALRILDFAHGVEHLSVIGSAVWGEGSAAAQTWVAAQARWLKRTGPAWLLGEVRDLLAGQPQSAVLRRELAYLEKRAAQMDYPGFRAAGWPVGSGIIESGNKLVVEARLKGAGMRWARAHVNPLLGLRNAVCNDRWAEAWASIAVAARAQRQAHRQAGHQARAAQQAAPAAPAPARAEEAGAAAEGGGRVNPVVVAQVAEVLRRPAAARAGSAPPDGREAWRPAANHPWKRPISPKARPAPMTGHAPAKS